MYIDWSGLNSSERKAVLNLIIHERILKKCEEKHSVSKNEILEAWEAYDGTVFVIDDREENKTTPETRWFLSSTTEGRLLKIVFVPDTDDFQESEECNCELKSAFNNVSETVKRIFRKYGGKIQ